MANIPENGDADEDIASDIDEVLTVLKIKANKSSNEIPKEEKDKEDLNKSSEEVIDTTK